MDEDIGGAVAVGQGGRIGQEGDAAHIETAEARGGNAGTDAEEHRRRSSPRDGSQGADGGVHAFGVFVDIVTGGGGEHDDRGGTVKLEAVSGGVAVGGAEDREVDAVGDHPVLEGAERRRPGAVQEPRGRCGHVQPAAGEEVGFTPPVLGRRIAVDTGVALQIRALAAAVAPAFALAGVGAVAGQQPGVAQVQDEGDTLTQGRQLAEVEVAAMEVVAVDDIRWDGTEVEEPRRAREVEVLEAPRPVRAPGGIGKAVQAAGESRQPWVPVSAAAQPCGQGLQQSSRPGRQWRPRQLEDVGVGGGLLPDRQPGRVPTLAVGGEEGTRGALGAAATVGCAHL